MSAKTLKRKAFKRHKEAALPLEHVCFSCGKAASQLLLYEDKCSPALYTKPKHHLFANP